MDDVPDLAENTYRALIGNPAHRRGVRQMQYRCENRKRCLLLDAIETPTDNGILLHQKRYKYSDGENDARSNEAGRRNNTYDGETHWRERSYFIGRSALAHPDDAPAPGLGITCDHVLDHQLLARDFHEDWNAGHAEIIVRADGSRYAVR